MVYSSEDLLPYDRPKLSKNMTVLPSQIALRPREWYAQHDIDLHLGDPVTEVDTSKRIIKTQSGRSDSYTDVIVCTGGV